MPRDYHLRERTISGIFWSFSERIGQQAIQFVIQIVLARLLLPEQFGVIAMLAIFMAVAQSFIDSGFGQALIQKQNATPVDESSVFYFNIAIGIFVAGLLCLAAPLIASFYKMPILTPVTRVLSLTLVINAFGLIQTSLMTKRVDFKRQMKVSMVAVAGSGAAGIILAYLGFGVWALVIQSLSNSLLRTIMLWFVHKWRPIRAISLKSLRSMFSYGSKLLFSGLLDTIYNNLYLLIIGKFFSARDLGFYSRARSIQQLPVDNVTSSVGRVTFPVFSSIQENKERLKRGLKEALKNMAIVNFALMIGLAVCARPLVRVLLSDKWLPTVPYLQLLCIAGMLYPLQAINLNVLKAQGRSDLFFWLEIIKKALVTVAIFVTYRWGVVAIIYGQIATSLIAYYLNTYYTGKMLKYPITEQIVDLLPALGLSLLIGAILFILTLLPINSQILLLLLQIVIGVGLWITLCWIFKISPFVNLRNRMLPVLRNIRLNSKVG